MPVQAPRLRLDLCKTHANCPKASDMIRIVKHIGAHLQESTKSAEHLPMVRRSCKAQEISAHLGEFRPTTRSAPVAGVGLERAEYGAPMRLGAGEDARDLARLNASTLLSPSLEEFRIETGLVRRSPASLSCGLRAPAVPSRIWVERNGRAFSRGRRPVTFLALACSRDSADDGSILMGGSSALGSILL